MVVRKTTTTVSTTTVKPQKKQETVVESVKEGTKRQLYVNKTPKEFNAVINEMAKNASGMMDNLYKQINEELMPSGHHMPDKSEFQAIIDSIKELRVPYKELNSKKKRQASPNNYGLKTPQYMMGEMCRFVNQHGGLPKDLLIEIDEKTDKGVFDRIGLTKFWVYYIEKSQLKDRDNKSLITPDDHMNKLFNTRCSEGLTFYQNLERRIREIQQDPDYETSNNSARFNKDSNGRISGFNYAALQVLLAPAFENGYTIPNQDKYIQRLTSTNQFLSSASEKLMDSKTTKAPKSTKTK